MKLAIAYDIEESMASFFRESLRYYPRQGWGDAEPITLSGTQDGVPWGDIYRPNDTFIPRPLPGICGQVYYVIESSPGSPSLLLQPEQGSGFTRPRVHVVQDIFSPEVTDGLVHVGLRIRPSARSAAIRQLRAGRIISRDRSKIFLTVPFWLGGCTVHVESKDKADNNYVFELLNSGFDIRSRIYQLDLRYRPERVDLTLLESGGRFRSVLAVRVSARLTEDTPYYCLPDGIPNDYIFDYEPITGITAILEKPTPLFPDDIPEYAEKAGDWSLEDNP